MTIEGRARMVKMGLMLASGLFLMSTYLLFLGFVPEMNLVKEFNIPTSVASAILGWIDIVSDAVALAGMIAAIGTGGASLIAAAGSQGVKAYIKKMYREKGRKATIAY